MNKIQQLEKRIVDHQKENGFETIFDFILEDLDGIKTSVSKEEIIRKFLRWYRYNNIGIKGLSNEEVIKQFLTL